MNTTKRIRIRGWMLTVGVFLLLQLIFFIIDITSWTPNFQNGKLFETLSSSKLFTEWFAPYDTPQFNLLTAFFAIALLPYALIKAVQDLLFKRKTLN